MHALIHKLGCGNPAFLRMSRPEPTDPVTAQLCRHLDGSQVLSSDPLVCESCGATLGRGDLRAEWFVEWHGEVAQ